ncbi:MAG: hypothetical protein KBD83_07900 [Gammaproteobacteria bacterium]|nr:hypothetical protein [Gammaproteobacteria bacterium]
MHKYFFARVSIAFFIVILLVVAAVFSCAYLLHASAQFNNVVSVINDHRVILTFIRICFFLCFFLAWPKIVTYRAKRAGWPPENIPKAVRLRYPIFLFFLFLEAMGQLSHGF